ncbi:MAG TPA: S8 family serine peptidase [Acidimicrobiales bacterium]|nr:S8 family serine peptidase [Acidimicrobiales bacterium]
MPRARTSARPPASLLPVLATLVCLLATASAAHAGASPRAAAPSEGRAGSILVSFRAGTDSAEAASIRRKAGGILRRHIPAVRTSVLEVADTDAAVARYQRLPGVEWAGVDGTVHALDHVPDNRFADGTQWNLQDLSPANPGTLNWHSAYRDGFGSGTVVAVVDTGVGRSGVFPTGGYDGFEQTVSGYDFVSGDFRPDDGNGHGTHIAGTIAQRTGNASTLEPNTRNSTAGVAPDARILAVRVLDNSGVGSFSDTVDGIIYAVDQGAKVVNLSLGGNYAMPLCDAVRYATDRGALVIAASGNESEAGIVPVAYPAACPGAVAVGAHQWDAQRGRYSNASCELAVSAPGGDIADDPGMSTGGPLVDSRNGILQESVTPDPDPRYAFFYDSGTSMAAAHVAGAAAVLMGAPFNKSAAETVRLLRATARDLGRPGVDGEYGAGAVDLAAAVAAASGSAPAKPDRLGYRMVAADGGIFTFGDATFHGSTGAMRLNSPIVGMAPTPTGDGYWLVAADGGVFTFGDAGFFGSAGSLPLKAPVVGMDATPTGRGYWLVASDGGVFTYGDAEFFGSTGAMTLNQPIVGMAATRTLPGSASGRGYWLVAADGGIFAFGGAAFLGSTGGMRLNKPVVGMARTPTGGGYWLVATDGGIFSFGDAAFHGSTGGIALNQPIVDLFPTCFGRGYWLVARDGGIFTFGRAPFLGSMGAVRLNRPIVGGSLGVDLRADQS